jgi:hypothetical protein
MPQVRLSRSLIFVPDKQPLVAMLYCATTLGTAAGGQGQGTYFSAVLVLLQHDVDSVGLRCNLHLINCVI